MSLFHILLFCQLCHFLQQLPEEGNVVKEYYLLNLSGGAFVVECDVMLRSAMVSIELFLFSICYSNIGLLLLSPCASKSCISLN